ncbi:hypothetical protein [uncultured Enterococcus sp.]|nr:hypothetical protein [uncultured Enterococcus sp.]
MTYEEIVLQAEANVAIRKQQLEEKAMMDYKAAQLNAYGFNDPKKMPKPDQHYPFLKAEDKQESESVQQQDWRINKARMMEYTEMIKQTRERKNKQEKEGVDHGTG